MKNYLLQELNIIDGHYYWFVIYKTDKKELAINLKNVYKTKIKNGIFQVVEVIY